MGGIWYMELAGDVMYNTLNYAIVSRHQINTCTVLYSSVLYCIKIRKFAHNQTKNRQTKNVSITEVHSFLSGSFPDTRGSWTIHYPVRGCHIIYTLHITGLLFSVCMVPRCLKIYGMVMTSL